MMGYNQISGTNRFVRDDNAQRTMSALSQRDKKKEIIKCVSGWYARGKITRDDIVSKGLMSFVMLRDNSLNALLHCSSPSVEELCLFYVPVMDR